MMQLTRNHDEATKEMLAADPETAWEYIKCLRQEIARLEKYACHRWTCDAQILSDDDATKLKGLPCTCGFAGADEAKHE